MCLIRYVALLLCFILPAGCSQTPPSTKTTATPAEPLPTQTSEEEKVTKILILGNSHSGDTFWLLQHVFQAQLPEEQFVFGYLYYSGCPITKHVEFAYGEQAVYRYSVNSDGNWTSYHDATMRLALQDQVWDYIVLQPGRADMNDTHALDMRRKLEAYVDRYVKHPYQFLWQTTWASPDDPDIWSPSWPVQPPEGYRERTIALYGPDPHDQFAVMVDLAKRNIVTDDTYVKKLCIGSPIMYSLWVLDRPQKEIYRDYTHLSDFGRLIASYAFFAQFTGQPITQVNIDVVPTRLRIPRFATEGDLTVTEEMKQVILEAVNNTLADPWAIPSK